MAELISLFGNDRAPRLLQGVVLPMTYRQIALKRHAERLGFIPVDAIISAGSALATAGIGAISNAATQRRQLASDAAIQKQLDLSTARNNAALQNATSSQTLSNANTSLSIQKAIPYIAGIAGVTALVVFLKSRKKRR
jgi:hypothetical protein